MEQKEVGKGDQKYLWTAGNNVEPKTIYLTVTNARKVEERML